MYLEFIKGQQNFEIARNVPLLPRPTRQIIQAPFIKAR
jgi:hypothetical protein